MRYLLAVLVASAALLAAATPAVQLDPGVPLVVPADTPSSVRLAVADLQRDLQKVLGVASPVISDPGALRGRSGIIVLSGSAGGAFGALHHPKVEGREAHGIHVRRLDHTPQLVLEGADPRGAIYAIYAFSDEFLDVPPLWYWADWKPRRRAKVEVAGDTAQIFPPASIRWRAWFNNDTDFLTPWRGRSAENNAAIYETALRLKYNTYEVGSVADLSARAPRFAPNRDAAGAHARGLIITSHHVAPLGSSLGNWEAFWHREGHSPPPLSVRDAASLTAFWRYHAETSVRAGFEQVWTIVFRGARDIPFWQTFPDAPADMAERAKVISQMLAAQVAIVKEVTGNPAPDMRTTLYNEGSTLFAAGLLRPPDDPTLIWNFVAARRDHFPAEDVRQFKAPPGRPIGYYLNFQFTSTGSHLAPAEGPWKMAANYRMLETLNPGHLVFTVVNAGNVREHLTELSANADMMWRFAPFDADDFLRRFCVRYYGKDVGNDVALLYRDYYRAFWNQKSPDIPGFDRQYVFQDMRYARAEEMLLKDMAKNVARPNPLDGHPLDNPDTGSVGVFRVELESGDASQVDALLRATASSKEHFAAVAGRAESLRSRVAEAGREFFDDNLLVRARLMVQLNTLLHETTLAYRVHTNGRESRDHLMAAVRALEAAKAELETTQHGAFAEWYASDRVFGIAGLRTRLQAEIEHATGSEVR